MKAMEVIGQCVNLQRVKYAIQEVLGGRYIVSLRERVGQPRVIVCCIGFGCRQWTAYFDLYENATDFESLIQEIITRSGWTSDTVSQD